MRLQVRIVTHDFVTVFDLMLSICLNVVTSYWGIGNECK